MLLVGEDVDTNQVDLADTVQSLHTESFTSGLELQTGLRTQL